MIISITLLPGELVNCFTISSFQYKIHHDFGAIAQLGERNTGSVEVSGSIPLSSTIFPFYISHLAASPGAANLQAISQSADEQY